MEQLEKLEEATAGGAESEFAAECRLRVALQWRAPCLAAALMRGGRRWWWWMMRRDVMTLGLSQHRQSRRHKHTQTRLQL